MGLVLVVVQLDDQGVGGDRCRHRATGAEHGDAGVVAAADGRTGSPEKGLEDVVDLAAREQGLGHVGESLGDAAGGAISHRREPGRARRGSVSQRILL